MRRVTRVNVGFVLAADLTILKVKNCGDPGKGVANTVSKPI